MGVTIHYKGKLNPERYPFFRSTIIKLCEDLKWGLDLSPQRREKSGHLAKFLKLGAERPLFVIRPHPDCEPLIFDFSYEWSVGNWVKTSFAPIEVHVQIIELLIQARVCFANFDVDDEGEYFGTRNLETLESHRESVDQIIGALVAKGAKGPVRLEDGRIVDCINPEN